VLVSEHKEAESYCGNITLIIPVLNYTAVQQSNKTLAVKMICVVACCNFIFSLCGLLLIASLWHGNSKSAVWPRLIYNTFDA